MKQTYSQRLRVLSILLLVTGLVSVAVVYTTSANNPTQNRGQARRVPLAVLQSLEPATRSDSGNRAVLALSKDGQSFYSLDPMTGELIVHQKNGKPAKKVPTSFSNVQSVAVGRQNEIYLGTWDSTVQKISSDGRRLNAFPTIYPWSIAVLSNGNVVVASPFNGKILHLYNSQGALLASFGDVRPFDADQAQNGFLNRGRVVAGSGDQIYYVSMYAPQPYVLRFSSEGQLLREFPIEGDAVDLQTNLMKEFLSRRTVCTGGVTIIMSAVVDPETGHLWLGMNGLSTQGTIYEYDQNGTKLRELALLVDSNNRQQNVTHVKDVVVSGDSLSIVTWGGTYGFKLSEVLIADAWKVQPQTAKTTKPTWGSWANPFTGITKFWAPAPVIRPAIPQSGCPADNQLHTCQATCPTGTTPNPADCGAQIGAFFHSGQTKRVTSSTCNAQAVDQTPNSSNPGGCSQTVNYCDTANANITGSHTVNVACNAATPTPTPTPTPVPTPVPGTCGGDSSGGCNTGFTDLGGYCGRSYAFQGRCAEPSGYDASSCSCPDGTTTSPIIIDVDRSGFSMTNAAGGVVFNILDDGVPIQIAWISPNSTNALLVLDRNGNGTIDSGAELFGDITPQPASAAKHGFLALAEYDKAQNGGNGDGLIDSRDSIFSSLRLWQDRNHNGVSESSELHLLPQLGVDFIETDFKLSKKTDQHGNEYRYRAKVGSAKNPETGRWAWDVFLRVQ